MSYSLTAAQHTCNNKENQKKDKERLVLENFKEGVKLWHQRGGQS